MRFLFVDAARARRLAKLLKNRLAEHGVDWPLHACRAAVAEATGYPSFHEIEASAGRAGASPVDAECPSAVVSARRELQSAALLGRGLPPELVAALLDAVPFTGAFGHGTAPATSAPRPTPRQLRIAASDRRGSAMRAGNFNACTLVDSSGTFLGIALGQDYSFVHDESPEGLLETFGVADAPATLCAARIPAPPAGIVLFADPDDGCATTLHLNPAPLDRIAREPFPAAPFVESGGRAPWRFEGYTDRVPDLVTGWSHASVSLAAFGAEARGRLRTLHEALLAGDLCVAYARPTGPILALANRLDLDASPHELVRAAWKARTTIADDAPKGSGVARVDAFEPRSGPFIV